VPDETRLAAHIAASGGRIILSSVTSSVKAGDAGTLHLHQVGPGLTPGTVKHARHT
jgi:hypothetical protein